VLSLDREATISGGEVFDKVEDAEEGHEEIGKDENMGTGRDWEKGSIVVQLGKVVGK
jgi:hypothetical protein